MKNIGKWQGETQIHRMRPKKQQRPNKRRKVTIVEPLNGPVTGTTPSPAEAIASTSPTSEANDGPTTVATGDAQRQHESTSENLVEATTNGTQTTANPPVEATTNGVSPAEATANGERIGDLPAEDTANERTDDLNFEQRNPDSPHVEASKATLQHEDAQLQRESGAQASCRKCKKRKAVSEGDHHERKSKRKRRDVVSEGDEASPEGDLSAMTMRLKTHKSVSQKRKRTREETGTDLLVTTNLLEERRNEIELSIHTYKTTTARRIHAEELIRESMTENPFAFAATAADEDTMYLHQARKEPDWKEFHKAMIKELNDHDDGGHWKVIPRSEVPDGQKVMRGVWSMKRKRRVGTGEIYKWKARLCIDGSSQQKGVNYWDTYSPVVSWETFRSLLTLAIMNNWETRQIDFVLAFPQAKVDCPMYMEVPQGCNVEGSRSDYVLSLQKNLYGAKQASRVWFNYLASGLKKRGFKQSKADQAVFYKGETIFIVYVDDGILIGPNASEINEIIKSLKKDYNLTDEGNLNEYLGLKVEEVEGKENCRTLTQPNLIKRILKTVGLSEDNGNKAKVRTPATKVLHKDVGGKARVLQWDYRSVIGMLNWLTRSSRPDILFAVSQVGRFMAYPKKSHEDAVIRICEYLRDTKDKGMLMNPKDTGFKVFADADFAGGYNKHQTEDPATAKSRSAYHIMFNDCLIYSHSKLQTEIALSTTEAEYICLSQALRTVLVLMRLFKELAKKIKSFKYTKPRFQCTAYEDNKGTIELAQAPKMRPRTKHINIKYHHFRSAVEDGKVKIEYVKTQLQLADIGTKPLQPKDFERLRELLIGW